MAGDHVGDGSSRTVPSGPPPEDVLIDVGERVITHADST
jgi:hypothetical protein